MARNKLVRQSGNGVMGRTELALRKQQEAAHLREDGRTHNAVLAERLELEATQLLAPLTNCEVALGEAIPTSPERFQLADTLRHPNSVGQEASDARLDLLCEAGVLELALDVSESIEAKNSVEKMMSHQLAAVHSLGMKLLAKAADEKLPTVEAARLANSARGLVETFQNTILTLQKLRTGGSQQIVVQRVEMRDQSQAVIASGGSCGTRAD